MIDDDTIKRLREAIAAGPTPGPWHHKEWGSQIVDDGVGSSQVLIAKVAVNTYRDQGRHNATYIAAASPDNIAALLDRLKAAEGECERLRESLRGLLAVTSSRAPGAGLIAGAEERHAAAIKEARSLLTKRGVA